MLIVEKLEDMERIKSHKYVLTIYMAFFFDILSEYVVCGVRAMVQWIKDLPLLQLWCRS